MNRFEYRLKQIEILLHAYNEADGSYEDKISELNAERDNILKEINTE